MTKNTPKNRDKVGQFVPHFVFRFFNRGLSLILLTSVMLSLGAHSRPQVKAWPSNVKGNDLPFDPLDQPTLMPLDQFELESAARPFELSPLPEWPIKEWRSPPQNLVLVAAQSPVKNQGSRGQCHTFSVTAAFEYAVWAGQKQALNFSEQCSAWKFFSDCQDCCNDPMAKDDGGYPQAESFYIQDKFMKFESDFSYSTVDINRCKKEFNDEPTFHFTDIVIYKQKLSQVKAAIDNNFVVVIGTRWRNDGWNKLGEYEYLASPDDYPLCTKETCGGHAVVLTGYDDNYFGTGKGGYFFKNSWSTSWSKASGAKPAGYGVMPYTYLEKYGDSYTAISHKNASPDPLPSKSGCKGR